MRKKARATIEQFYMLPHGAKVVVGFSGGADSVALLHFLASMREEFQWELSALHVHHGLRGAEADADAAFATAFAATLGISCAVKRVDVRAESRERRMGEEECGRLLRYGMLQEEAGTEGWIVVAHHQKDQAETLLMRLCRGTGLTGLTAMSPVRDKLCRPLLFCTRKEIEDYCKENYLVWREDSSNSEEKYTRNKLRHRVIPALEEINSSAVAHIAETAALLSKEEDYLEREAARFYEVVRLDGTAGEVCLHRKKLQELHPAMKRRVLRKALSVFMQTDIGQAQIVALEELLEKETGKRRHLLGGVLAENRYEAMVLYQEKEAQAGFCLPLSVGESVFVAEAGLHIMLWVSEEMTDVRSDGTEAVFDYDTINGAMFCRTRKTGDFIRLRQGRKKLKDIFIDEKIPRAERERIPLIVMGDEVLWIPFLRISTSYAVTEKTKRFLHIRIKQEK